MFMINDPRIVLALLVGVVVVTTYPIVAVSVSVTPQDSQYVIASEQVESNPIAYASSHVHAFLKNSDGSRRFNISLINEDSDIIKSKLVYSDVNEVKTRFYSVDEGHYEISVKLQVKENNQWVTRSIRTTTLEVS